MFENLNELPRQDEDQAAVMFDRSEHNDPSTYINYTDKYNEEGKSSEMGQSHIKRGKGIQSFVIPSEYVMNEKDLVTFNVRTLSEPHAELELYPGDRINMKKYEDLPDHLNDKSILNIAGKQFTIRNKQFDCYNNFFYYTVEENKLNYCLDSFDTSTLIRANKTESPSELHPGDKVNVRKYEDLPDFLKDDVILKFVGKQLTIKDRKFNSHTDSYSFTVEENKLYYCLESFDLSTLVKIEDVKSKPNTDTTEISYSLCIGDIVEWSTSKEGKYVCLMVTGLDGLLPHHFFKSGNVDYAVDRIKRIVHRLGENCFEKSFENKEPAYAVNMLMEPINGAPLQIIKRENMSCDVSKFLPSIRTFYVQGNVVIGYVV